MHEYSVVNDLLEQCDMYARDNNALCVERIIISIGERSAIEPSLLLSAFETFKQESRFCATAELEIQIQKVKLQCYDCGAEFEVEALDYASCKQCGTQNVKIIAGSDMLLLSIEMNVEDNVENM